MTGSNIMVPDGSAAPDCSFFRRTRFQCDMSESRACDRALPAI
jgi:hypothetical protein